MGKKSDRVPFFIKNHEGMRSGLCPKKELSNDLYNEAIKSKIASYIDKSSKQIVVNSRERLSEIDRMVAIANYKNMELRGITH